MCPSVFNLTRGLGGRSLGCWGREVSEVSGGCHPGLDTLRVVPSVHFFYAVDGTLRWTNPLPATFSQDLISESLGSRYDPDGD